MKVWAICQDCNLHKGVIVSKVGFTHDAIKFAGYNGIGLVELREPLKPDLENRIEEIDVIISAVIPKLIRFNNILHEEEPQKEIYLDVTISDIYYFFPNGYHKNIINLINDFFKEIKQAKKLNEVMEKRISFPNGTYLKSHNSELNIRVQAVYLKGLLKTYGMAKVEIKWEDKVWLIMKSIFERKMFTISHEGNLQEVTYD